MNDRHSHARAWLAKAVSDLTAARRLVDAGGPYDAVCFHAQQAGEKALKALLAQADAAIPRTHNLEELLAEYFKIQPDQPSALQHLDVSVLTPFAVELRYDLEFSPEVPVARDACGLAERIVAAAALLLGVATG